MNTNEKEHEPVPSVDSVVELVIGAAYDVSSALGVGFLVEHHTSQSSRKFEEGEKGPQVANLPHLAQSLLQIRDDVFHCLDPD